MNKRVNIEAWTLLELVLVLSIVGVTFGFLIPVGTGLLYRQQVSLVSNQIQTAVHAARAQAWVSKKPFVLAPRMVEEGWSSGMKLTTTNQLVFQWYWPTGIRVTWHGFQRKSSITFHPLVHKSTSNGYFLIEKGAQQIKLPVNRIGTVSAK